MILSVFICLIIGISEGLLLDRFLECILYSKNGVKAVLLFFVKILIYAVTVTVTVLFFKGYLLLSLSALFLGMILTAGLIALKKLKKGD